MSPTAPPPPPQRTAEQGTMLFRAASVGAAFGAGAAAAVTCVIPAALRVSAGSGPSVLVAVAALSASALIPMTLAVFVVRRARESLKTFAGPDAFLQAFGVGLWFATLLVLLSVFGSLLRALTHHHALAGVTYAFGALALAAGDALVCARFVAIARLLPERGRRILLGSVIVGAAIVLFALGIRFVRVASRDAASYAAAGTVVDVLAFVLAAVFASRLRMEQRRPLAVVSLPFSLVLVVVGVVALRDPGLCHALRDRAPAFAPASDLLGAQ